MAIRISDESLVKAAEDVLELADNIQQARQEKSRKRKPHLEEADRAILVDELGQIALMLNEARTEIRRLKVEAAMLDYDRALTATIHGHMTPHHTRARCVDELKDLRARWGGTVPIHIARINYHRIMEG